MITAMLEKPGFRITKGEQHADFPILYPFVVLEYPVPQAHEIGLKDKGQQKDLTSFLKEYGVGADSIVVNPGGLLAVLYNIERANGTILDRSLDLRFTKNPEPGQSPIKVELAHAMIESFLGPLKS